MKTIKYLSDGTVAKVGMRVKVKSPAYGEFNGEISVIKDDQLTGINVWFKSIGFYILINPDISLKTELFERSGLYCADTKGCTPIK